MSALRELSPPLALVTCDFRLASTAWRGALSLDPLERAELARSLAAAAGARGLVVLETCNRTEWIVDTFQARWAADLLVAWMRRLWQERGPSPGAQGLPRPEVHLGGAAARHFVRVAAGLESFVLGEREIATQVNRALEEARSCRSASPLLNELGQAAARTVRQVERESRFRDPGRGVQGLVVARIERHAESLQRPLRLGLVGFGAIGRKSLDALARAGQPAPIVFNRTRRREDQGRFEDIETAAASLDVLIVATGARQAPLRAAALACEARESPLLVLDLGSPAQVDREGALPSLVLEGLDELLAGTQEREELEDRARFEELVERGLEEFLLAWRKSPAGSLLRHLQESRDELGARRLPSLLREHLADLPEERRRRLERALRGLVLERDQLLLEQLQESVAPPEGAAP